MRPKIVILISGSGTNMQAIAEACAREEIDADIAAVISNRPDVQGLQRAEDAGIETQVLDHKTFESREAFDGELIKMIDQYEPELVVLAGFMRILTADFVRRYQGKLINIHPSLLPKYQGLNTHQRALDNGDSYAGATVHYVTGELDGGPPVLQARVPVNSGDDADTLAGRVLEIEHRIYPVAVNWHLTDRLTWQDGNLLKDGLPVPPSGELWEDAS